MIRAIEAATSILAMLLSRVFVTLARIHVEERSRERVRLNANSRQVSADRRSRLVRFHDRPVTHFGAIQCIDITHYTGSRGVEWWAVSLRLIGERSVSIGNSGDDLLASTAAAALSTVTEKPVRSLEQ